MWISIQIYYTIACEYLFITDLACEYYVLSLNIYNMKIKKGVRKIAHSCHPLLFSFLIQKHNRIKH